MVLLFLAGISHLKFPSAEDLFRDELDFKDPDFRGVSNRKVVDYFFFLAHLIYESQTFSLFHNLASAIVGAELFAAWYHIAPFDCQVLAHFLALCGCSLKSLDLHMCGLTNQSLEIMKKVNLVHRGTTQIEEVNFSYNPKIISKLSLLSDIPMFQHTKVLIARGLQSPEGISCITNLLCLLNMRHLTSLEISVNKNLDSNSVIYLSLNKFRCPHWNIDSQNAVNIFRSLEHISLEELDLTGNSQLTMGDSEAVGCAIERMLNVNRTLKVLNLSSCRVTEPIVKHIQTGLTKNTSLVTLNVSSTKLSVSCAVSLLQQMTTHPTLSTVCEVNVLGVGEVEIDRGTMWCVMDDLIPEKSLEFFQALNNSGLKVSKLNVKDLTYQTVECFAVGLAESRSVQAQKLKHCNVSSAGAVSIFRSLEHNTSLEELDLSESWQQGDSEKVGCAIKRMLNLNRTLKVLKLNRCKIDTTVINHIAAGLAHNAFLAELNIGGYIRSRNKITSEGWVHLFKALSNNTSLKKLNISYNNLGVEGSVALAEMLSCNKSITELNLKGCDIPEAGLREITKGLFHNTSLIELDIKLGMEGSVVPAEILSCNKSLTELNLRRCDMSGAGVRRIARELLQNTTLKKESAALADMLSCNKSLTKLNLELCHISVDGLREIARGLLQNTTLQTLTLWPPQHKTFLEAEIERLKKSGKFTPQSSSRLEIKADL